MPVATNPLSYNAFVTLIGVMAVVNTAEVSGVVEGVDPYFNAIIPQMLNYAELRIQRDLDLLPLLTSSAYAFTAGNNVLSISIDDFVTVQTVTVGVNAPLLPVSKEFLQNVYGDPSYQAQPAYFAMIGGDQATGGNTSNNIMVGPWPDQNYAATIFGTQRMPSLYLNASAGIADTGTTFISTWLPDLLVQAAMVFITEYQRNFGATSNDPQMGVNYENQYQTLLKGAMVEEARKKFNASGWSSMSPALVASPAR